MTFRKIKTDLSKHITFKHHALEIYKKGKYRLRNEFTDFNLSLSTVNFIYFIFLQCTLLGFEYHGKFWICHRHFWIYIHSLLK